MRILVGLDGSPQAMYGLDFVRSLALGPSDEVVVATIAEVPMGLAAGLAGPSASLAWYGEVHAATLEEADRIVAGAAAAAGDRCRVETVVREGHPVEVLQTLARERSVDLLVVGPHGRGRLEAVLFGSVSQALLHAMPTAILVARPIRDRLATVLLAADGSPSSAAATRFLAALPLPADSAVVATAVIPTGNPAYGRPWPDEVQARIDAEERAAADRIVAEAVGEVRLAGRSASADVRTGMPKRVILEAAEEHHADLIVLGARGLGGFESLLLGSVSRAVSKAAICSTLVVHGA